MIAASAKTEQFRDEDKACHSDVDSKRGRGAKTGSPILVGNVEIATPFFQAALSGYSDSPMRVIARRHGAAYSICEVMLDQFLVTLNDRKKNRHFLEIADEEHPVGGQLMGSEPAQFAAGAVKLAEAGFDIIDINFGCPVKKVLGRCRGGFHLSQPDVALEIVARVRDAVPADRPVTLKMRRGLDDSAESRDNFYRILDGAFALGAAAITVHGRTVKQRYVGPSRWDFLTEVKQHVGDRLIFGSGDLFSAEDCIRMLEQTGVDGVTIARGAIGNPWIFEQVDALWRGEPLPPPPTLREQASVILEHYALCEQTYGIDRAATMMRKFCIKYSAGHPQHETIRELLVRIRTREQIESVLQEFYYDSDLPGRYLPREIHGSQEEEGCG